MNPMHVSMIFVISEINLFKSSPMKKILLAFDGSHYSEGALLFAKKLNEKNPVLVTASFLPQVDFANLWSYSGGANHGNEFIPLLEESNAENIKRNISRFEAFCHQNHFRFRVHRDYFNFAIPELKKESRYADLLIISSELFYEQAGTTMPNEYLEQLLHEVECPVMIVPEKFEFPKSNILSYDGSGNSVFAIKQFAWLFPELAELPTTLVYRGKHQDGFPDDQYIRELISAHYPQTTWIKLDTNPKQYFGTWMSEKKGACLISGSFGRGDLSRILRKSFITDVIAEHRLPVFIAHR
jgi:nucleotide-binding universal stress UspA family protein